ncbi:MAG: hypothetical protein OXH93_13450 [Caldilineaceae bacterium]|nr:hypothetical protein [Caldilineaceae bacterium]
MKLTARQTIPRSVQQREYHLPPRFSLAYAARGWQRNELTAPEPHSDSTVFLLSAVLLVISWVIFGRVEAPAPGDAGYRERQKLRYRWPFKRRIARL